MHKYFNFAKIFEAEQMGEPLSPEEMGTPTAPETFQSSYTQSDSPVTIDFNKMQETHMLDVLLTKKEKDQLELDGTLTKPDTNLVNKTNATDIIQVPMKITITEKHKSGSLDDPNAISFVVSQQEWEAISKGLPGGIVQTALPSTKSTDKFSIKFALDQSLDEQPSERSGVAPSDEQIKSGSVPPPPVEGEVKADDTSESRRLMSFSQFVK
jgi:hypothetical protein